MEKMEEEKMVKKRGKAHRQILTALIATVPAFTYGVQIGWLSPMASILKSAENSPSKSKVTESAISWMAAALPLTAIVGIPFFSYASDRFGRKYSIIVVSLLSCISWLLKLTLIESTTLIIARSIAGLAAAGCFVVIPVYVKEISEDHWRGALGSLVMTMCKVGVIFVYTLGMLLSYRANQTVYLCLSCAHAVVFCFMPESPNYLVKTGKIKKATKVIAWLRSLDTQDCAVQEEIKILQNERQRAKSMPKITLCSVVRHRPSFSALRMTLVLMGMQTLSGCFALMNYAADVFSRAGTQWSPNVLALFVGSLQLAGSFFTTMSIEKFGRKIPLASSSLMVSLCMTSLATYFLLQASGRGGAVPGWLPVGAVCVCILAYGAGLAPVPFVIMAEVFTFELRARMAGVSMAFSFFCSSMTVLFYAPIADAFGAYVVFYCFGAVGLFGVIYTLLCVPETRGKSLEDIQAYWEKDDPVHL